MVNIIEIKKFLGKNSFNLWCIALLKEQGIWAPLSSQPLKVDKTVLKLQDEKAHSLILFSLSDEVLYEVSREKTASALWLKLEKLFMMKSICNKFLLTRCFFGLQMREGTPPKEHFDELNYVLIELYAIDVKIEDEDLAMILLASLRLSYKNLVSSLNVGNNSITLEEVNSSFYSR